MIENLVSIIIPAYNCEKYLPATLSSILGLEYNTIEVIIIDDGSTDNTENIIHYFCKQFEKKEINYFIKRINNSGVGFARNLGISIANGEFLQFLDSDDLMYPRKFNLQVDFLKKNQKIGAVYSRWEFIDDNGDHLKFDGSNHNGDFPFFFQSLIQGNIAPIHTYLFRSSLFSDLSFDESIRSCEDWDLLIQMSSNNVLFGFINKITVGYRMRNNSMRCNTHLVMKNGIEILRQIKKTKQEIIHSLDDYVFIGINNLLLEAMREYFCINEMNRAYLIFRVLFMRNKIEFWSSNFFLEKLHGFLAPAEYGYAFDRRGDYVKYRKIKEVYDMIFDKWLQPLFELNRDVLLKLRERANKNFENCWSRD